MLGGVVMFENTKEKRYRKKLEREAQIRRAFEEEERRREEEERKRAEREEEQRRYEEYLKQKQREELRTWDPLELLVENIMLARDIDRIISGLEYEIDDISETVDRLSNDLGELDEIIRDISREVDWLYNKD